MMDWTTPRNWLLLCVFGLLIWAAIISLIR